MFVQLERPHDFMHAVFLGSLVLPVSRHVESVLIGCRVKHKQLEIRNETSKELMKL